MYLNVIKTHLTNQTWDFVKNFILKKPATNDNVKVMRCEIFVSEDKNIWNISFEKTQVTS